MNSYRILISVIALTGLLFSSVARAENASPSILVLLDDKAPVDVNIFLKKDAGTAGAVGAFTGGLGGLFVGAAIENRNKKFAEELAAQLPPYTDRLTPVSQALVELFRRKLPEFTVSVSSDQNLISDKKPDFSKTEVAGANYVLTLTPSLSYQTSNYWKDLVISGLYTKATLFETAKQKKLFQRQLFSAAGTQRFWKDAVAEAQPLVDNLPSASQRMATGLYFNLLRADALHQITQNTSAANRYPEIKPLLKSELKRGPKRGQTSKVK